jgi:hypothetical protein
MNPLRNNGPYQTNNSSFRNNGSRQINDIHMIKPTSSNTIKYIKIGLIVAYVLLFIIMFLINMFYLEPMERDPILDDFDKNTKNDDYGYKIEPAFYVKRKSRSNNDPFSSGNPTYSRYINPGQIFFHTLTVHTVGNSNILINYYNRTAFRLQIIHKILSTLILLTLVTLSVLY